MINITHYKSPLGDILLASDNNSLIGVWFEGQKYYLANISDDLIERKDKILVKTEKWLDSYFNGEEYHVTDGELILDDLTEDIYYVTAFWEGDDKYMPGSNSSKFLVYGYYFINVHDKVTSNLTVNITADSNINTNILNGTMNFSVYYYDYFGRPRILGTVEAVEGKDGIWWAEYTFDIGDVPDIFLVGAKYSFDDVTVHNGTLSVLYDTPFFITAEDVDYGSKVNITLHFSDNFMLYSYGEDIVDLYVNNKTYSTGDIWETLWDTTKYVFNDYTIPDILAAGQYTVTAVYRGNNNTYFITNTSTTNFTVRKVTTTITINASDIIVGSNAIINATLPESASGKIILIVNGSSYTVDSGESITIPNLNVGTYDVVAIYNGDQNYTYNYAFKSFNVIKKNLTISLDATTPCYVDTPITLTATLGEIVNGTVMFNINGENYTKVVSNSNVVTFDYTPIDNSTLTVVATFLGNDKFNTNSSNTRILTVNKIPIDINVTSNSPIFVGEQAVFTINLNVSVNTTVKLKINGETVNVAVVNGVGTYNVSGLPANDGYDVNVTFAGDSKYTYATNNTTLVVNKLSDYPLNVTTENIVFGDDETITVVLPADINKDNLVVKVDGDVKVPVSVVNGVATVVVPGLTVGQHEVNVTYLGDDKYEAKNNNSNMFTVSPSPNCNIVLDVDNKTYGEDTTFTVTLPSGVTENVTITVDGKDYSRKPDAQGVANLTLNNLTGGLHTVTATYPGDGIYSANSTSDTFVIPRAASTIDVEFTTPKSVGDDVLINVTMGQEINGTVILSVGDNNYAVAVTNGNGSYVVSGLTNNVYNIKAEFKGDENYTASASDVKQLAIDKVPTSIVVAVNATINVGQVAVVNVTINKKLNGSAVVSVNGENHTVAIIDGNGTLTLANLAADTYTINATFKGDSQYIGSTSNTATLTVNKIATDIEITVNEPVTYGEDAVISIELDAPVNTTVKLTVDSREYNVPLTDGKGGFNASGLTAGPHEVNVTFAGDNKYVESNDTATFTIDKADLTADVIALNVTVEENTMFVIDVPDDYNGNVSITVDGKVLYNDTAKIIIDADKLTAGDKTADVVFYGDDNYGELTLDDIEFTVSRVVPEIAVDIDAVTYPDKAVAVINVANKANGTVNITVDGKVFKGEIKNGEGSVDLTGLSAGAKVADVKFFTSDDYNDNATSTAKFNINKANSTITITVEPEYVYNDTITIDLDPSFDGVVNVTVNGVIYPVNNNQVVIDRIAAGDYTIIANLAESQNYTGATNSTTFKVKQAESNITIEVESIYKVGDDIVIRLTTENITDSDAISVTINGESYKVVDNEVIITGGLDAGKYIINAVLAGNENYTTSSANKSFEVIKLNTTIFIYATTPREVGSPFDIGAVLGHSVTGDVVFTINGTNYTVKIVDDWIAVIEYTPVNNDTVNVVATFMGDDKYNSISTTGSFDVDKVDTEIEVTVKQPVTYGEDAAISIELDAPINTTVKLTVDGTDYNVGLINGKGSYNVSGLNAGPHEVNVTYAGDAKYIESNNSTTFTIEKADLTADVTGLDVTVEQNTSFVIDIIKDFNGNVSITVDGEELYNGPANTIVEGSKLSAGDKTADVVFYGDSNYDELTIDNVEFTVSRVTPEISVEIDNVDYPNNTTATIAVSNNANGTVEITVDSKKYKGEIKNGEGTVELTDLTAGAKVAEVEFISGDDYNDNANTNAKFTVNKADTPISLEVEEGLVGELTNITVGLDAPGIVSVKVNDTIVYVGPVNDGSIVIPVSDLTKGDYEVIVDYYGDENYKPNSTSSSFTVDKNSTYNFDATPTVENQTLIIDIDLPDDATGNITVNVDGENITVPVNDTISLDLDPGNHTVNVTYNGDDKYEPKSKDLGEITIPKVDDYPINATVVDDELIVSVPEDATGNVTITIGEDDYVVPIEDGKAVLDISGLDPGDYVADVTYPGDDKYGPNSNSTEFTIPKVDDYPINATVVDDELIVSVPEDATGNVKINIGDKDYTVPIKDGKAVLDISGLNPGDYVADVTYPGDDKYGPNSNSTKFTVPKIDNYPMNMTNTDDELVVSVPEDATGNVKVNIDGKDYTVPIKDGKAVLDISDLPSGEHDVIVTYPGNDKYAPKTIKGVINTTVSLIITAPDVVKYYSGPERFIVYCTDDKGNNVDGLTINITIHGVTYTRTTSDGKASIALTLNSGNYTALVEFGGKDKFKPQTLNATVEILPTIYAKDVFKVFRNGTQYYALFTDGEGNPLPNINVTFNIHGVFYTRTTNSTGWAKLNINLLQGKYIITAFNPVTGEYRSNNVTVFTLIVASDLTKYFRNESQFIVRVRGPDGNWAKAGEKVTFNIHGVFYTRYTNETGHIKLNIGLEYGDYIVTTYYKDAVEANHIKVLPRLIVSDFVMTYGDGSEFVAKTLDGQGNIAPYQKVSFNVFGVLYDRITDGNGETRLKIPLPPGEYLMTSVYMEEIHANKVTIKG